MKIELDTKTISLFLKNNKPAIPAATFILAMAYIWTFAGENIKLPIAVGIAFISFFALILLWD